MSRIVQTSKSIKATSGASVAVTFGKPLTASVAKDHVNAGRAVFTY
jgi:hypothetical protein